MESTYPHKVTAFILQPRLDGDTLLLFRHPTAGIQIPAGTIEPGEAPEAAALREASEESGLTGFTNLRLLATVETTLPGDARLVLDTAPVYSHPDNTSFNWASFRRGIQVRVVRREGEWVQAEYIEYDLWPVRNYVTYHILGWVLAATLSPVVRRAFYRMEYHQPTPKSWEVITDNHVFAPFWAPIDDLPPIIPPQDEWVKVLRDNM